MNVYALQRNRILMQSHATFGQRRYAARGAVGARPCRCLFLHPVTSGPMLSRITGRARALGDS
jgi:hypothetical protein